jgi:hypothetical protein
MEWNCRHCSAGKYEIFDEKQVVHIMGIGDVDKSLKALDVLELGL